MFAALAVASALPSIFGKHKRRQVADPNFFVNNPSELESLIKQKTQASYGGMESAIRENLSNAGVLSPSSLSDALTRSSIGQGQDIASQILNLYQGEFARKQEFDINKYFQESGQAFQENQAGKQSSLDLLLGLGGAVGQYYGGGKKKKNPLEDLFGPSGNLDFNPAPDAFSGIYG